MDRAALPATAGALPTRPILLFINGSAIQLNPKTQQAGRWVDYYRLPRYQRTGAWILAHGDDGWRVRRGPGANTPDTPFSGPWQRLSQAAGKSAEWREARVFSDEQWPEAAWSPAGDAVLLFDKGVVRLDCLTGARQVVASQPWQLRNPWHLRGLDWSPDGHRVAYSVNGNPENLDPEDTVELLEREEPETWIVDLGTSPPGKPWRLGDGSRPRFSFDSRFLAALIPGEMLRVYDLQRKPPSALCEIPAVGGTFVPGQYRIIALRPDGQLLVHTLDGRVETTLATARTLSPHRDPRFRGLPFLPIERGEVEW